MKLSRAMTGIAVLAASVALAGCGAGQKGSSGTETGSKQVTMDEQQATKRAEDILHQPWTACPPGRPSSAPG